MSEDLDALPARERARVRRRERKRRGPGVVVDNPGLRNLALILAEKRRRASGPALPARGPKRPH